MSILRMWRNSLVWRVDICLAAILISAALAAGGLIFFEYGIIGINQDINEEYTEELQPVARTELLIARADSVAVGIAVTGDGDGYLNFKQWASEVDRSFAAIDPRLFKEKEERSLLDSAARKWEKGKTTTLKTQRDFTPRGTAGSPAGPEKIGVADSYMKSALADLSEVEKHAQSEIKENTEIVERAGGASPIWVSVALAAIVIAAATGSVPLIRSISKPLAELTDSASAVKSGGSLRYADVGGADEINRTAQVFNNMVEKIKIVDDRLTVLATHDSLTGLYNRREFLRLLREEVVRAERQRTPISFLMIDIDGLNDINNDFGHQAGDTVLLELAILIQKGIRAVDRIGRYGGEEIAVALPDAGRDSAAEVAERLRKAVAAHEISIDLENAVQMTVSIGITTYPTDTRDVETLIERAEQAMYQAKEKGRDCVVSFRYGRSKSA